VTPRYAALRLVPLVLWMAGISSQEATERTLEQEMQRSRTAKLMAQASVVQRRKVTPPIVDAKPRRGVDDPEGPEMPHHTEADTGQRLLELLTREEDAAAPRPAPAPQLVYELAPSVFPLLGQPALLVVDPTDPEIPQTLTIHLRPGTLNLSDLIASGRAWQISEPAATPPSTPPPIRLIS
jgi:hypothetical protein